VKVGDLIKFNDAFAAERYDYGVVMEVNGRNVMLEWAKTGWCETTIDRLLSEKHYFEVINE